MTTTWYNHVNKLWPSDASTSSAVTQRRCSPMSVDHYTCTKCGAVKPAAEFPANRKMRSGLSSWCRGCHRALGLARARRIREAAAAAGLGAAEMVTDSDAERFWSKATRPKIGCWEWQGALDRKGYGRFSVRMQNAPAHQVAYVLTHGQIDGQVVMHLCDNARCVRPDHLAAGTYAENNQHMWDCGRGIGTTKLLESDLDDVLSRLSGGESQRSIAASYGVSQTVICNVNRGVRRRRV